MRRSTRRRLTFLLVVLTLLVLAGWQLQRDAGNDHQVLTTLDPASIRRITLTLPNAPPMHYQKRDGHWWRIDEAPARADDARLGDLADIAGAPVLQWRAASDFDPAKIGLAPPRALLQLNGQTITFGEASVTGPQHYVRVGQRVALVSARYMPRSPSTKTTELQ